MLVVELSFGSHNIERPPAREHEDAARCLAFHEQDRALRIGDRILDSFKGLQRDRAQIAKGAVGPHLAGKTAFNNMESVW
jgi:hypothetical protein